MHPAKLALALGLLCILAVAADEGVKVFGRNNNHHLGTKDTYTKPTDVEGLGFCVRQMEVSASNAIYISCDNKVYVSGRHIDKSGAFVFADEVSSEFPVQVTTLANHHVVMGALGDAHFVVLTNQGKVFSWGFNNDGQLGYGVEDTTLLKFSGSPVELESLSKANIRMIAAGGNRSAAVSDSGLLYLWGAGGHGEMGDGSTRSHKRPTLLKMNDGIRFCQVSLGATHVAAVTRSGDLYTWGDGNAGQLGLGDFGIQKKRPMPIARLRKNVCFAEAASDFTAAITQDERMFLWGSNGYPSLFEKTFFQGLHPCQVGAGSLYIVVLLQNGSLATWGFRRFGQVGCDLESDFTLDPGLIDVGMLVRHLTVGRE